MTRSVGSPAGMPRSRMWAKAGRRKEIVFPLPVAATPMTSRFCIARGQQYCWICEGAGNPALCRASWMEEGKGAASKVAYRGYSDMGRPEGSWTFTSWSEMVVPVLCAAGFRESSWMPGAAPPSPPPPPPRPPFSSMGPSPGLLMPPPIMSGGGMPNGGGAPICCMCCCCCICCIRSSIMASCICCMFAGCVGGMCSNIMA
mmetsp:Transcript_108407/g.349962  ORF Transcript_108407/g.349962 Transcript_108407/m.349962 type:complete len:201 (+) Transcript_108407:176-778(+)